MISRACARVVVLAWLATAGGAGPLLGSPAEGRVLLTVTGRGAQVYRCDATANPPGWVLDHPDAKLVDEKGKVVGQHGAGPTWRLEDGSSIKGVAIEKMPSPEAGSVPWLVVKVTEHDGSGLLEAVETVRRTATHGGSAPATGCDAGHGGAMLSVPYSATYMFYSKP